MENLGVHKYRSWVYPRLQSLVWISRNQHVEFLGASSFRNKVGHFRSKCVAFLVASMFSHRTQACSFVSDSPNFVAQQSPQCDYGYVSYGELSQIVYCLLQKISRSVFLPLVEKGENYMLPKHSPFALIE